jgi:hypothetical protein
VRIISVLDTSVTSFNLGNQIVMESVYAILNELFPDDFFYTLPWEGAISRTSHRYMRGSDYVFFGGTNSLSSYMLKYKQMSFRPIDLVRFNDLTLLGLGWWQYQGKPDLYSRVFIRRLLSDKNIHSVRDGYTKNKLGSIGISNVINTCCPTTWKLTPVHCARIPLSKSDNVILTLTDYNTSRSSDALLLAELADSYKGIYCWIQGIGDLEYIRSFKEFGKRITLIPPKLGKYDECLKSMDCDYIGTRLHAGIRAIQQGKRALVLAVDNRASEIAKDINLNVKLRSDALSISEFISGKYKTDIVIPIDEIKRWKAQFL